MQGEQASAPAAAQVEPRVQLEQFVLEVGEQAAARYLPAAQPESEAQAEHGSKPVAEYVLPAAQPGTGAHELDCASQV